MGGRIVFRPTEARAAFPDRMLAAWRHDEAAPIGERPDMTRGDAVPDDRATGSGGEVTIRRTTRPEG